MNAIVGLCHFCEAHGPRPVFCTFTTDDEVHTTECSKSTFQCNGCTSLGPETVLVSKDDDGTIFYSRESVPNAELTAFLRQAAVRSITCEVSWSKEGGVVYFSDTLGHVLSYTFQMADTRARGLKRWFSIVVLMKDKMLLLNISTLLSEHMQGMAFPHEFMYSYGNKNYAGNTHCHTTAWIFKILLPIQVKYTLQRDDPEFSHGNSLFQADEVAGTARKGILHLGFETTEPKISNELQHLANVVFDNEQKICSQRALRLKTGRNDFGQSRSLIQLTGDEDVFKNLHGHFTWMLRAGAHIYTETLYTSQELLTKLNPLSTKNTIFEPNACSVPNECIDLRALETLISRPVFRNLMYCTLCGVHIYIKCIQTDPNTILIGLGRLIPKTSINLHIGSSNSEIDAKTSCVLEETENDNFVCKWTGSLPAKCPTIMNRIESSMRNEKFNDAVLHQHVKSLQLEWLGIAKSVKAAIISSGPKSDAVVKLKQILGVSQHDEQLMTFWMNAFG